MIKEKIEKRIYYLNIGLRDAGELAEIILKELAKENNINLEFLNATTNDIPEDFDVYILHLSDVSEYQVQKLRDEFPWSYIYCITGASTLPWWEFRDILDGSLFKSLPNVRTVNYEDIIKDIKIPRRQSA